MTLRAYRFLVLLAGCALISACGSTIRGVGKDVTRVGRGVKMIFVSEEASEEKQTAAKKKAAEDDKPTFSDFFRIDRTEDR